MKKLAILALLGVTAASFAADPSASIPVQMKISDYATIELSGVMAFDLTNGASVADNVGPAPRIKVASNYDYQLDDSFAPSTLFNSNWTLTFKSYSEAPFAEVPWLTTQPKTNETWYLLGGNIGGVQLSDGTIDGSIGTLTITLTKAVP